MLCRAWVHNNCMYLLAGWNRQVFFADYWCFNFGNWCLDSCSVTDTNTWREIPGNIPKLSQTDVAIHKDLVYTFSGSYLSFLTVQGFDANLMDTVNTVYVTKLY